MVRYTLKSVTLALKNIESKIEFAWCEEQLGEEIRPFERYLYRIRRRYLLRRMLEIQLEEFRR